MASLDFTGHGSSTKVYDPELATSVLLTRRTLDHIEEARGGDGSQGRSNGGDEVSDEELAFRIQSEYLAKALELIEDGRLAKTFDQGAEASHPSLNIDPDTGEATQSDNTQSGAARDPPPLHRQHSGEGYTRSIIELYVVNQIFVPFGPALADGCGSVTTGKFDEFSNSPDPSRSP
jgi:hypothetical protein